MKFETVEDAAKHIELLNKKISDSEGTIKKLEKSLTDKTELETTLKNGLEKALKEKSDSDSIATDLLNKLQTIEDSLPKKVKAKVAGKSYEVIFGVDGLTKEELAGNKEKLEILVKSGSSAIKLLEG